MDVIKVEGGATLSGTVSVEGAKNSALKLMAATIMAPGVFHLTRIPDISDVRLMCRVLETLGATVVRGDHELAIDTTNVDKCVTPYELVSKMRASISVLGPLIVRFGRAVVAMPGGCNIGARSIDQHLMGLEALGVHIENNHGYIYATTTDKGLVGTIVTLDFPSVGATENVMMASIVADGVTTIENAAREPEIVDLANMLNEMGADVRGAGTTLIEIHGVHQSDLHACMHETVGDRIEAGTFIVAGALCGNNLTVTGFDPDHLDIPLRKMAMMGIPLERHDNGVTVSHADDMQPVDIQTLPYPGFPTDMQAQFMTLATMAQGNSFITENVFENRFMLVAELVRMGANISVQERHALIKGPAKLSGAQVASPDLRGGAALVLAGLVADGTTLVSNTYHIARGYERFTEKLRSVGAYCEHIDVADSDEYLAKL